MEPQAGRGRLRVYLGAAPGVGKTYAMLNEGRRRLARGTDVVVGIVETHDRAQTAEQLQGLEVVPRRTIERDGSTISDLDLDAVLERAPEVCLVDELAHTNPAGWQHDKRWRDIDVLLAHGIDVITTVNIQHLESLNDVTEAITGVRQRETVPDVFVRSADAIELVDMSPQALRRRMAHGNVYAAHKVDAALGQFFREGNLAALRHLALLWLADRVDEALALYRTQHDIDSTWATTERILVAVTGGPESEALLRRAARIASRAGAAGWSALLVTFGDGLAGVTVQRLEELRQSVDGLGGTFHTVAGDDAAEAILAFAKSMNATQIVLGASRSARLISAWRGGIGERVIASSGEIDVHIVTHDLARKASERRRARAALGSRRVLLGLVAAVILPVALTGLLQVTADLHGLPTEALSFMALVVAVALIGGLRAAMLCALISAGALNFFFTQPLYTMRIASNDNVFAVGLFVIVGIAVALVVDRAARLAQIAARARRESDALSALTHQLLTAGTSPQMLLENACELLSLSGAAILDEEEKPMFIVGELGSPRSVTRVLLKDGSVLALTGATIASQDRTLIDAVATHASVLLERRAAEAAKAERRALAEADRTRTALLAAVSHDLRSPLAAVLAAVADLRHPSLALSQTDRQALLETIAESSQRLDALVENLLDMSRIRTGAIKPAAQEISMSDLVARVLSVSDPHARVEVLVPPDLPLVDVDAGLAERVLANLVENALFHGCGAPVRIDAVARGGRVITRVVDEGPGVDPDRRYRLFEPFQRLGDAPSGSGVGLGLAVAKGLAETIGGVLSAEDTPGGGLTLVLDLPVAVGVPQ